MGSIPSVVYAEARDGHRLLLRFDDGVEGLYDVAAAVPFEGVFAQLRDPAYFAQVRLDHEAGTVVWPNGADLDPVVLHARVTGQPIELAVPAPPDAAH
ncbi:MAG TPA: DUF2442 domain-containing protein [Myxococcota bacterium]|jgi:hypothetical protein|nr:DUF2442 domain-containing protein [Myxococcota bacterium]